MKKINTVNDLRDFSLFLKYYVKSKYLLVFNDDESYKTVLNFDDLDELSLRIYNLARDILKSDILGYDFLYKNHGYGYNDPDPVPIKAYVYNEKDERLYMMNL